MQGVSPGLLLVCMLSRLKDACMCYRQMFATIAVKGDGQGPFIKGNALYVPPAAMSKYSKAMNKAAVLRHPDTETDTVGDPVAGEGCCIKLLL